MRFTTIAARPAWRCACGFLLLLPIAGASAAAQTVEQGRFGRALRVADSFAAAGHNPVYNVAPRTVEFWVKVSSRGDDAAAAKAAQVVLLANEPRNSVNHWELVAAKGSGALAVLLPGYEPKEVTSSFDVADGKWHHVAFVSDGKTARLYADAREVASSAVKKVKPYPDTGPLTFGHFPGDSKPTAEVLIDEVRICRVARALDKLPDGPFAPDADTIGLWHFDEDEQTYQKTAFADASNTRNPARLELITQDAVGNGGFDGTRAVAGRTRWMDMDFGPFFSSTLKAPSPPGNVTHKAISIRLGKDRKHAVAFDTELLRMSAAWEGEFLKIPTSREGLSGPPDVGGKVLLWTLSRPGWVNPRSGDTSDPRPDKLGPLPADWAKYKGLYVHGDKVILSYTVGDTPVLEMPGVRVEGDAAAFTRTFHVGPGTNALMLRVCDHEAQESVTFMTPDNEAPGDDPAGAPTSLLFSYSGGAKGMMWRPERHGVSLELPARQGPLSFKVVVARLPREGRGKFKALLGGPVEDLPSLIKGAPPRYPDPVATKGELGKDAGDAPYVVDTLTAPDDNPWKSFLRFGGHDFFSSGDCAVCSVSGDVWVVSGIDDKLEKLKWRRYATGLFQPLGLKIVDDNVYVTGRDQITRLHDLNGDGEADFYENFNNDAKVTTNGHAYVTGLETDTEGNFYYVKCGDGTEHGGTVLRVTRDGSKLEVFATGVRNSNGLGAGPNGEITEADNQGEWVPASRIDLVEKDTFLGFQPMSKRTPPPKDPGRPIVWMPQNVDNSSGGQVWVTSDKWGPFQGHMLHTSYGAAALLHVMTEKVQTPDGPVMQGGVVRFPLNFSTGIMRGRFRPADGQLYVSGLRGWQTAGVRDGALHRVRYTGKPVRMPLDMSVHKNGIRIAFTCPLDKETATDPESYGVLQWNYKWSSQYGSPQFSVKDPEKQGYDTLEVKSVKLSEDGRSVFLEIPDLRPVMQMKISCNVDAADGADIRTDIYNTIHALGPALPRRSQGLGPNEYRSSIEEIKEPATHLKPRGVPTYVAEPWWFLTTTPKFGGAAAGKKERKIVLIAGKKSHGPGEHEYEKGARLLKHCLDTSPNVKNVKAEVVLNGWPEDPKVLDDADTIFLFCDGSDRDEKAHPLLQGDRLDQLGKLMDRGCGLVCMHYTVFVPTDRGGKQFQDWIGAYFDYDSHNPAAGAEAADQKKWYSKLGHATTDSTFLTPDHPVSRGCKPFTTKTEYYWKMRFREGDDRMTPILTFDPSKADPPVRETLVAWAVQRKDGGRGFAFTEGHFHSNWQVDSFRKMVLNALLWTAGAEVPEGGVESQPPKE